jgi:hypothetical protein
MLIPGEEMHIEQGGTLGANLLDASTSSWSSFLSSSSLPPWPCRGAAEEGMEAAGREGEGEGWCRTGSGAGLGMSLDVPSPVEMMRLPLGRTMHGRDCSAAAAAGRGGAHAAEKKMSGTWVPESQTPCLRRVQ